MTEALARRGLTVGEPADADVLVVLAGASDDAVRRCTRAIPPGAEVLVEPGSAPLGAGREGRLLPTGCTPDQLAALARSPRRLPRQRSAPPDRDRLSRREREVLGCVAQGYSNAKIADVLALSPNTVRTHVQNLLFKLQAPNRTVAVALAHRRALL